jgi:hypothetical protein
VSTATRESRTVHLLLAYLARLPVDVLEMDREFIGDVETDLRAAALVAAVGAARRRDPGNGHGCPPGGTRWLTSPSAEAHSVQVPSVSLLHHDCSRSLVVA